MDGFEKLNDSTQSLRRELMGMSDEEVTRLAPSMQHSLSWAQIIDSLRCPIALDIEDPREEPSEAT